MHFNGQNGMLTFMQQLACSKEPLTVAHVMPVLIVTLQLKNMTECDGNAAFPLPACRLHFC